MSGFKGVFTTSQIQSIAVALGGSTAKNDAGPLTQPVMLAKATGNDARVVEGVLRKQPSILDIT
jgi:hypothetical protein